MLVGREFRRAYWAYYPGLEGYVYGGDFYDEDTGREIMERILSEVDLVEYTDDVGYILHMTDGRVLYALDSNDFPQPTSECLGEPRTTLPPIRRGALASVSVGPHVRRL